MPCSAPPQTAMGSVVLLCVGYGLWHTSVCNYIILGNLIADVMHAEELAIYLQMRLLCAL